MIALHLIINSVLVNRCANLLNCIWCSNLYLSYGSCIVHNYAKRYAIMYLWVYYTNFGYVF